MARVKATLSRRFPTSGVTLLSEENDIEKIKIKLGMRNMQIKREGLAEIILKNFLVRQKQVTASFFLFLRAPA